MTIQERLAEIRELLNSGVSYEVKRQIVELLVDRVTVTTIGEGRDRHIEAEIVFSIDRNALRSSHTDIIEKASNSELKLPPIRLKQVVIHGLSAWNSGDTIPDQVLRMPSGSTVRRVGDQTTF